MCKHATIISKLDNKGITKVTGCSGRDVRRVLKHIQGDAVPQAALQDMLEHLSHGQAQTRRFTPCFIILSLAD